MRKVHLKVVLDVFVHAEDDVDSRSYIEDVLSNIGLDAHNTEDITIVDWNVESVEVTDSR